MSTVGEKIKYLRKEKGETQNELALAVNISRVSIGNYERNDRSPDLKTVGNLSRHFRVKAEFFFSDKIDISEVESYKYTDLFDFVKELEEQESKPLKDNEFLLTYKENDEVSHSIRGKANSFEALFDLINIGTTQDVKTVSDGISAYSPSSTYYKGRKLTDDEIKQVKNLIDAILNKE